MNIDNLKHSPTWQRIEQDEAVRVFEQRRAVVDEFESTKTRVLAERPDAEAEAKEAADELAQARKRFEAAEAASLVAAQRVGSIGVRIDAAERRMRKALRGTTPTVLEELRELAYARLQSVDVSFTVNGTPADVLAGSERVASARARLMEIRDQTQALMLQATPPAELVQIVARLRSELES